ncbi:calcium-binding EF-hand-containing protein [Scytonema sp. HK-05]|uniref:EF-hand domain-containing protein n=1 Tax=Scytonema sp. HK-05 TaxID=1137095 RepID=UPI0009372ECC|nr:EF-hand domain-containing protein [Scytonema sp. HK-05]OKH45270.1 hypothetical protein NIES2130_37340 [Scytonema sp. HK-05]BAY49440.1 calcium-binding EF-hand-containing protein [Scytonema sp. HK-05]
MESQTETALQIFGLLAQALFSICDRDNDGSLEQSEFAKFHEAFGCTPANSQLAFKHLDADGDGTLTVEELLNAWHEYYTSNDPQARGNWLYGDPSDKTVAVGKSTPSGNSKFKIQNSKLKTPRINPGA